jgi:hypothetical protein
VALRCDCGCFGGRGGRSRRGAEWAVAGGVDGQDFAIRSLDYYPVDALLIQTYPESSVSWGSVQPPVTHFCPAKQQRPFPQSTGLLPHMALIPKIDPAGHELDAACAMARKDAKAAKTNVEKSMVVVMGLNFYLDTTKNECKTIGRTW